MNRSKSMFMIAALIGLMFSFSACGEESAPVRGSGTALILINLQTDYLSPNGKLPIAQDQAGPLIKAVNAMIQASQRQAFPVMYAMNQFSSFAFFTNFTRGFSAMRYSPGQLLDPQVNGVAGPYFTKDSENAFANSEFTSHLEGLDCGNLVVAGVYAGHSVLTTVKQALADGYKVTVISDAVGASSDGTRDTALEELKGAGAKVETSSEFISTLGPSASGAMPS